MLIRYSAMLALYINSKKKSHGIYMHLLWYIENDHIFITSYTEFFSVLIYFSNSVDGEARAILFASPTKGLWWKGIAYKFSTALTDGWLEFSCFVLVLFQTRVVIFSFLFLVDVSFLLNDPITCLFTSLPIMFLCRVWMVFLFHLIFATWINKNSVWF